MGFLLALCALALPASAEPVSAPEMYALVHVFGRKIQATTFSDPARLAYAVEAGDCYIGVYDRDQVFAVKRGLLHGPNVMCQILTRRDGRQISYIDACDGREPLAEGGKASEFSKDLRACSQKLLRAMMSGLWNGYVTRRAIESKGSIDRTGKTAAETKRKLLAEASAYDRWFGRKALLEVAKPLWSDGIGGKQNAVDLFKKAPWWGEEEEENEE